MYDNNNIILIIMTIISRGRMLFQIVFRIFPAATQRAAAEGL